ncbi:MAG: response regulator [Desulfobulbaceae bacterium]|nr:response regulator [Desulfobulbaceae bacterium]
MGRKKQNSQKILVIDDDPTVLELIKAILGSVGYRVEVAQDGKKAMELAECSSEPIDLLLTDVVMPGMGGEEVALSFKKEYPFAHVLFMSAYLQPPVEKYQDMHGKVDFVMKPFTMQKLKGMVKRILSA